MADQGRAPSWLAVVESSGECTFTALSGGDGAELEPDQAREAAAELRRIAAALDTLADGAEAAASAVAKTLNDAADEARLAAALTAALLPILGPAVIEQRRATEQQA